MRGHPSGGFANLSLLYTKAPTKNVLWFYSVETEFKFFLLEDTLRWRVCKPPSSYYAYIHRPDKQNISTLLENSKVLGSSHISGSKYFPFYCLD
jgi:hypothetical protein